MNAPANIAATDALRHRVAVLEADHKRNQRIADRAEEIVNKRTPRLAGSVNPLHNMAGFVERCAYHANRNRLIKLAKTELRCLEYALEYWQADYDAALAGLSRPTFTPPTLAEQAERRQQIVDQMAARRAAFDASRLVRAA